MFKIHSHACLEIKTNSTKLLVDPWLVGSCYWRSWWNYPPVKTDFNEINPDFIYITHVHWDHWHGPTLKKFLDKNITIITHDEPNKRSFRDLNNFGFKNIKILKHGETLQLNEIKITPYQFGLFLNDSALVIETPEYKILNANDCKIAGQSLDQIMKNHGEFQFAFRSHSSANDRVCYKIKDSDQTFDDPLHYSRSFKLFMDHVKPHYAIPFASNHCHLHKDVFHFNDIINDPFVLGNHINDMGGLSESEFVPMLPGDSWSKSSGFEIITENKNYFKNKDFHLKKYLENQRPILENYYGIEKKQKLTNFTIKKFKSQLNSIPKLLKRKIKGWSFLLILNKEENDIFLEVNPYESLVKIIDDESSKKFKAQISFPIIVFNNAVNMNMFHHSGISKRNKYLFHNEDELRKWEIINGLLEKVELEVFPLRFSYFKNFILSYFRRWREILVYIKAFVYLKKGYKIYDVEEKILSEQ